MMRTWQEHIVSSVETGEKYLSHLTTGATVVEYWPGLLTHYISPDIVVASHNRDLISKHPKESDWHHLTTFPAKFSGFLHDLRPLRRLLRSGIRSFVPTGSCDSFITFYDRKIYSWSSGMDIPQWVGNVERGNGPLIQGCCMDSLGNCYYGEYTGSREREEVRIWYRKVDDPEWRVYFRFPQGRIRHVHAVQLDPHIGRVWVATGDSDAESMIGYFVEKDGAPDLRVIATGGQHARAVSMIFTAHHVYWGSDAGKDTVEDYNWIYRWSRQSQKLEKLAATPGPVFYSALDVRGRMFFSTSAEGSRSERDSNVHILFSADGLRFRQIGSWSQDRYPCIAGTWVFGTPSVWFPVGTMPDGHVYVSGDAIRGGPATWVIEVHDGTF